MCRTTDAQRGVLFKLEDSVDNTILLAHQHLSTHESSDFTYSMVRMTGLARLVAGTTCNFSVECDDDGAGLIVNTPQANNTLIIKGAPLPNGYTLTSG